MKLAPIRCESASVEQVFPGEIRRAVEAELYAFVHILRMLRVARMMSEFALGYGLAPSRTYCDNQAVVFAMRKRDLTSKSRHIRVHLGFCYDMLDCDGVKILYVGTEVNPANGLTAAEAPDRFARTMDAVTGREPQGKPAQLRSRKNSAL